LSKRIVFSKNFLTVTDRFYSLFFYHYLLRSYEKAFYLADIIKFYWRFILLEVQFLAENRVGY
jgi:hypothetical protein